MRALYEAALTEEFRRRNIQFFRQPVVPVMYRGVMIGERRLDFIVGRVLVVELKAVETLAPLHSAQVKSDLKITKLRLSLLINFNTILLKDGIKRILNPM